MSRVKQTTKADIVITTSEQQVVGERENYSKVILQKQMVFPVQKITKKQARMENNTAAESGSPGLVRRRILEMSQQDNNSTAGGRSPPLGKKTTAPPPPPSSSTARPFKRTFHSTLDKKESVTVKRNGAVSPTPEVRRVDFKLNGPSTSGDNGSRSKLLLAPKPFRSLSSTAAPNVDGSSKEKASFKSEKKSTQGPAKSPEKPTVPPKPRNVSIKLQKHPRLASHEQQSNDDVIEEVDDVFHDSPLNCSFTKLSQKIEDQRFDLLKRRQSYSEFEDLIEKKRELRERMMSKIMLLREERDLLLEEKADNDALGGKIATKLERLGKSCEIDKYRQFLEEIDQITKLTVSLNIRLSRLNKRIENGSMSKEEAESQQKKKGRLVDQINEVEYLRKNTDRRSLQVRHILGRHLDKADLHDYDTFLVNLIKHITDLKETEQRIQLGEEQLVALNDNLIAMPQ